MTTLKDFIYKLKYISNDLYDKAKEWVRHKGLNNALRIDEIVELEDFFTHEDMKAILHKVINNISSEDTNKYHPISLRDLGRSKKLNLNPKLIERIIRQVSPHEFAMHYPRRSDFWNKDQFNTDDVIWMIELHQPTYKELQKVISKSTPAALDKLKSVIWEDDVAKKQFIVDEEMKAMDVNMNTLIIDPNARVKKITFPSIGKNRDIMRPSAKPWALLFADFKKVPYPGAFG